MKENNQDNINPQNTADNSPRNVFGISTKEYKHLKIKLEEMQEKRKNKNLYVAFFALLCAILVGLYIYISIFNSENNIMTISISSLTGFFFGTVLFVLYNMYYELRQSSVQHSILVYEANHIKGSMKEDIFENSINMSYKYLDQYYLQTREQAHRGFFVTLWVAVFGAILTAIGIIAMFLGHTDPSYITCASGVITEFISAVFFYLYNKTTASMSKYHNKLVLSQNISIALKVADSLPDQDKVTAKNLIITELLKDINNHLISLDPETDKEQS